jgi:hypothetical protein
MTLSTAFSIFSQIVAVELVFIVPCLLCAWAIRCVEALATSKLNRAQTLSTKKLSAIELYAQIRTHDMRGKATVKGIVAFTLEAERMSDKKLYAWLEGRSWRWAGKSWNEKVRRAAAPAVKAEPRRTPVAPAQPVIRRLQARASSESVEMTLEEARELIEANKGSIRARVA